MTTFIYLLPCLFLFSISTSLAGPHTHRSDGDPHAAGSSQTREIQFEHLTTDQGLSSNNVLCILRDSKGFMWFGTDDGLNKYDGYSFAVYRPDPLDSNSISWANIPYIYEDRGGTLWLRSSNGPVCRFERKTERFVRCLSNTPVSDFHEDASGTVWVATHGRGLNRFNRSNGTFTQYTLSNDSLDALCEDPDEPGKILWIATAYGLDRFDVETGGFSHFECGFGNHVRTIVADRLGFLWIGSSEGLYRFAKVSGTIQHYSADRAKSGSQGQNDIQIIYEDSRGTLWIGTFDGLATFSRSTETFTFFRRNPKGLQAHERVHSIYEDRTGILWVGSFGGGLRRYDRANNEFTFYSYDPKNPKGFDDYSVYTIYEDPSGTLWFGTDSGGINKIDRSRKPFISYTQDPTDPKSLSDNAVTGIIEDSSGVLWVATRVGLNRFDKGSGSFTHFQHDRKNPHSLGGNLIYSVFEDSRGTIWLGTIGRGLDRLDLPARGRPRENFIHYTHDPTNSQSLGSDSILSLFEDKERRLWIGTMDAGLDEFDMESGVFTHYHLDPKDPGSLNSNWVNAIYEDKSGVLWVGVGGGGLNRFDRSTRKFTHYIHDSNNPKSLSYGSVHSIYEDSRGVLWIGTAAGLNSFDRSTESFTPYFVRDGITSDFITAILEDSRGVLWLKTGKGISTFNPRTGDFKNYDASDGVNIHPTWGRSACRSRIGEMFFGGTNGFTRFHPDSIRDNPYVFPAIITTLKKFDRPAKLDTAVSEKKEVDLSYQENVFSLEFVSPNYSSPEKNQYKYKLEGFDHDWVYCGTRRYATYMNLDGGTYVFRVKGTNNDGIWNQEGTSITVIISPPFWETWWFKTLAFLAALATVGGSIRYIEMRKIKKEIARLEQEHAIEQERLRISRDMHDEVGATLTQIAILSELAKREVAVGPGSNGYVQKISEHSREVLDNIGQIIWAINPKHDHLDNLAAYLRAYAVQYFSHTSIRCRLDFPDTVADLHLSAESRRNVFLIVKEALHNVVKHADATEVVLRLTFDTQIICFEIRDNGKGLHEHAGMNEGIGLRSMQKRAQDIGGTIEFEPNHPCGLRVRLGIPLGGGD